MLWAVWSSCLSVTLGWLLVGVRGLALSNWSWKACQPIPFHYCYLSVDVAYLFLYFYWLRLGTQVYLAFQSNGEVGLRCMAMIKPEPCCDSRARLG